MKRLTHKELQDFSLEILTDIADFCEKEGLKYSLAYGTLLGAIRHKGFIPWDDDIDIIMPREDYNRFRETYKNRKFIFVDSNNTPDCFIAFGRVCDTERTITRSYIPWHGKSIKTGVWIDVFPVDHVRKILWRPVPAPEVQHPPEKNSRRKDRKILAPPTALGQCLKIIEPALREATPGIHRRLYQ